MRKKGGGGVKLAFKFFFETHKNRLAAGTRRVDSRQGREGTDLSKDMHWESKE